MDHNTVDLKTIATLNSQLGHLCRRIGAETFSDAAEMLENLRQRSHRLANDVYARDLILNQIKRQLGCDDFAEIMPALAINNARMAELERAMAQGGES